MNEQLQTALAELITSTLQAKEFIVGELPEVVRQLLQWNFLNSLILSVVSVLLLALIAIVCTKVFIPKVRESIAYRKGKNDIYNKPDVFFEWFIFSSAILTLCLPSLFMFNIQWPQIWIAPKVWLIEYAASLVK